MHGVAWAGTCSQETSVGAEGGISSPCAVGGEFCCLCRHKPRLHLATEDDGESLAAYMIKLNHTFKKRGISNGIFLMFHAVNSSRT